MDCSWQLPHCRGDGGRSRRQRSRRPPRHAGRTPRKLSERARGRWRIFLSHPSRPNSLQSLETEASLLHTILTRISIDCARLSKMLSSQAPNRALRLSLRARHFSTSRPVAAVSPYRSPNPATSQSKVEKRTQSTAAAAVASQTSPARAVPSPAFNRSVKEDVQPLQAFKQPEMDHSFVGMNGGQIFHEMMLRHNVKHVCE